MSSLYLADKPALNTIGRVRAMARRHKMRYGLDMLMVDYLQLMDGEGRTASTSSAQSVAASSSWQTNLAFL